MVMESEGTRCFADTCNRPMGAWRDCTFTLACLNCVCSVCVFRAHGSMEEVEEEECCIPLLCTFSDISVICAAFDCRSVLGLVSELATSSVIRFEVHCILALVMQLGTGSLVSRISSESGPGSADLSASMVGCS